MSWTWTLVFPNGTEQAVDESFPNQSDAESWLGTAWRDLAASGATSVSLRDGDAVEYTMSLAEG